MKRIKAEMWDKMQYLFRNYYDRMVHAVLYYDGKIDIEILKNTLLAFAEKTPLLHSSFVENPIKPYWKVEKYTIDDIFEHSITETPQEDIMAFITHSIPVSSNVQFNVRVFEYENKCALCMLVNHMCFDGGDFKYFLGKLAQNYNAKLVGVNKIDLKSGSRSHEEVYTKLNKEEEKVARGLYKNISTVKDKHEFPFTPDSPNDKCNINLRKIEEELFLEFKKTGKKVGVTVNDLMLTVYIRALYQLGNYDKNDSLTIPCMVDLRRHVKDNAETSGLTNHTGFMQCSVKDMGTTINDTLLNVLKSISRNKRDKYLGLYSLPLLKLAYGVFPHAISEFAIKIGYLNPLIGMSNIGILDHTKLNFGETQLLDGWMTGGIKYKPYMQLALTTCRNSVTMSIAQRGNEDDEEIIQHFFDLIIANIKEFIEENKD